MLQLIMYLCWFTKYTTVHDVPGRMNPKILILLIKMAAQDQLVRCCHAEYPGYDVMGRQVVSEFLVSQITNPSLGAPIILAPSKFRFVPLPMGITGAFA